MSAAPWWAPRPGSAAHAVQTTIRAVLASLILAAFLALSYFIPS